MAERQTAKYIHRQSRQLQQCTIFTFYKTTSLHQIIVLIRAESEVFERFMGVWVLPAGSGQTRMDKLCTILN